MENFRSIPDISGRAPEEDNMADSPKCLYTKARSMRNGEARRHMAIRKLSQKSGGMNHTTRTLWLRAKSFLKETGNRKGGGRERQMRCSLYQEVIGL